MSETCSISHEALSERVRAALQDHIAKVLNCGMQLESDAAFGELGFDSITLMELCDVLNRTYGLDLVPPVLFEYPDIRRFADFLAREYRARLVPVLCADWDSAAEPLPAPTAARAAPASELGWISLPEGEAAAAATAVSATAAAVTAAAGAADAAAAGSATSAAATAGPLSEPIAIIGMSACFPRAPDIDTFWENLVGGSDCLSEVPAERWDWKEIYGDPATEDGKTDVKCGGFIEGLAHFDSMFFGIAPAEAELMDPEQRLLLEHAWQCIEDAGYSSQELSGTRTGVFVGIGDGCYGRRAPQLRSAVSGGSFGGPNRLSYLLDLRGPSEPVDTACSSSLVALHRAVQAIRVGECDAALVGGVNAIVAVGPHVALSRMGVLSHDGRCRSFARDAQGYGRGEGIGVILLKRLSAAERDADPVYAIIRGSGVNHGGRANSLTSPNPAAQAELIAEVYRRAGIDPRTIGFIEAQAVGTAMGDAAEINGLKSAFRELQGAAGVAAPFCAIGSVKSSIGHLERAAGIAGLIKVVLQLKHRQIVKTLHCEDVNPYIQLDGTPFYLARETKPWESPRDSDGCAQPRRAGISAFGLTGVNAHVVLEEYVSARETPGETTRNALDSLIVLSAKSEQSLRRRAEQLLAVLDDGRVRQEQMASLACTLQTGRDAMSHRLALKVASLPDLQEKLRRYLQGAARVEGVHRGEVQRRDATIEALNDGGDAAQIAQMWMARGNHSKLLELWARGLAVNWRQLRSEPMPARLRLPTYPFAKERHWLPAVAAPAAPSGADAPPITGPHWVVLSEGFSGIPRGGSQSLFERDFERALGTAMPGTRCMWLGSETAQRGRRHEHAAVRLLDVAREILNQDSVGGALVQLVVATHADANFSPELGALLEAAALDNNELQHQVISAEPGETVETLAHKLTINARREPQRAH